MFKPDATIAELESKGFQVIGKQEGFQSWEIWSECDGRQYFTLVTKPKPSRVTAISQNEVLAWDIKNL